MKQVALTVARIRPASGGAYRIRGSVTVEGAPAVRRLVLWFSSAEVRLPIIVSTCWSGSDGAYTFDWIAYGKYFVAAFDYTQSHNAAVADLVTPEPMP